MWLVSFQEQRRLISLRQGVFSCLVYNLTAWYTCFFSVYFTLSLSLSLWLPPHLFLLHRPPLFTKQSWAVQLRLSLAKEVEKKKKGGEDREAVRHPLGSLGPTRTNKQHCLFWSRARSCREPFHVFHQLSHLLSDTPKNERGDETASAWKKTAGVTSSQPPNVPLLAWWRGDLTGTDRQQLH